MSKDFPWASSNTAYRDFITQAKNTAVDKNFRCFQLGPLAFSLGDKFAGLGAPQPRWRGRHRLFLKSMIKASTQKEANLKDVLNSPWITLSVQPAR